MDDQLELHLPAPAATGETPLVPARRPLPAPEALAADDDAAVADKIVTRSLTPSSEALSVGGQLQAQTARGPRILLRDVHQQLGQTPRAQRFEIVGTQGLS